MQLVTRLLLSSPLPSLSSCTIQTFTQKKLVASKTTTVDFGVTVILGWGVLYQFDLHDVLRIRWQRL